VTSTMTRLPAIELVDWRRQVALLYERARAEPDPQVAHQVWREGRRALLGGHPQSPLAPDDPMRQSGPQYWPYDPSLRFVLPVLPSSSPRRRSIDAGGDGVVTIRAVGELELPGTLKNSRVTLWWVEVYAGGLFLPLRDGTAGDTSYGGGRYLLDTAKGADLGSDGQRLVVDLNFLYHPSCRYSDAWTCPLADDANRVPGQVCAGERM
jgi:uncharacterized protein (DUF1684 family)